jgi:hypothetical protein
MSVLACCRGDCDNIMCSRYSSEWGYLCDHCFAELVHKGSRTDLLEFMESHLDRAPDVTYLDAYEKFDKEFPE